MKLHWKTRLVDIPLWEFVVVVVLLFVGGFLWGRLW